MAFSQFVFAMTDALVRQLVDRFAKTAWSPLNQAEIDTQIELKDRTARGVYLLGRGPETDPSAVYVGQSNSALFDRLSRHAKFLQDRYGLPYEHVRFKALGVVIFDSVALEERLITEYHTRWISENHMSGWNGSGIGSNDTCGRRDQRKPSAFDRRFPIDITLAKPTVFLPGKYTAKELFETLKNATPYAIRMAPTPLVWHADLKNSYVEIRDAAVTVLQAIKILLSSLPSTWSVQMNPARILIQRDVEPPPGSYINPKGWLPDEWTNGWSNVIFRREG